MKKIIILLLIVIISLGADLYANSHYNNVEILKKDNNRKSNILDKTAVIRFKKSASQINSVNYYSAQHNFRIVERVLKKEPADNTKKFNKLQNYDEFTATADKLGRTYVINYEEDITPEEFCNKILTDNPDIELAEPYKVYELQAYYPSDPKILNQVMLDIIKAFDAWEIHKGSEDIIIGISDSGVEQGHEDLKNNIYINTDEIPGNGEDNDGNGYIDDYNGYNFNWENDSVNQSNTFPSSDHGVNVAGIAAASTDNGLGIAGTGFKSRFFPLKITNKSNSVIYAYQSIIYAADNGFDVLNMSWGGTGAYSEYEQSVIDYAVARDVALVASAGNIKSGMTSYVTYYPASYYGVLGVGESDYMDMFSEGNSVVGISCDILAMGEGNEATKRNNDYMKAGKGTSFASPVVAGVVAIARAAHPNLDAVQVLEFVRQSGDDVTDNNYFELSLLPKRVNMLNVVVNDPFDIPAVKPSRYIFLNNNNEERDRFRIGDTVTLNIAVKNYLGDAEGLKFTVSVAYDSRNSIQMLQDEIETDSIKSGEEYLLEGFSFVVTNQNDSEMIFRLDIDGDNGYNDFVKFGLVPTAPYTTFKNENYQFTLSDYGTFGFYNRSKYESFGTGFRFKDFGNQIYKNSGLIAAQRTDKGLAFILDDFMPVKPFAGDNANIGIVNDGYAASDRRIGIDIIQEVKFNEDNPNYVKIILGVKNSSKNNLDDVAVGYFIDWDIGANQNENYSSEFPAAIPDELKGFHTAAKLMGSIEDDYPVFGMAITSEVNNVIAQSAGLVYGQFKKINQEFAINMLNSGTTIQSDTIYDIGVVMGMKFNGILAPDEIKECEVCFAASDSRAELAEYLKKCLGGSTGVSYYNNNKLSVYPQPADEEITISGNLLNAGITKIRIFDIFGNDVISKNDFFATKGSMQIKINISNLTTGRYFISVNNGAEKYVLPLTVVK